jgi:hypothetical protein
MFKYNFKLDINQYYKNLYYLIIFLIDLFNINFLLFFSI